MHIYMPDAEPSKVVVEAKKLLGLLGGLRRVLRHGVVPDQLRTLMSNKMRNQNPVWESFWTIGSDHGDSNLESCDSEAAVAGKCCMRSGGANADQGPGAGAGPRLCPQGGLGCPGV